MKMKKIIRKSRVLEPVEGQCYHFGVRSTLDYRDSKINIIPYLYQIWYNDPTHLLLTQCRCKICGKYEKVYEKKLYYR